MLSVPVQFLSFQTPAMCSYIQMLHRLTEINPLKYAQCSYVNWKTPQNYGIERVNLQWLSCLVCKAKNTHSTAYFPPLKSPHCYRESNQSPITSLSTFVCEQQLVYSRRLTPDKAEESIISSAAINKQIYMMLSLLDWYKEWKLMMLLYLILCSCYIPRRYICL